MEVVLIILAILIGIPLVLGAIGGVFYILYKILSFIFSISARIGFWLILGIAVFGALYLLGVLLNML